MGAEVQDLLGLTFEHFTRAVVLPQNAFAQFLHDKPKDRQELLGSLLGFDVFARMMQRARALASEQESSVRLAEQRLVALADCTDEQRVVWQDWVARYAELRQQVRDARDALAALDRDAVAAADDAKRHRELAQRLGEVKVPAAFARVAAEREQREADLRGALEAGEQAAKSATAAQAELEQLGPRDPLVAARRAFQELDQVRAAHDDACTRRDKAEAALAPAVDALAAAEAGLAELQLAHAAHGLVGTLAVGEPCPVCEQPVANARRPA
jgi:exonuclease SbcC